MLVEGAGGACWNIFCRNAYRPDVAAVDVAVLRVFGVVVADADAGRANVTAVDAVDADRVYVAGVDFPEKLFMQRMLQLFL